MVTVRNAVLATAGVTALAVAGIAAWLGGGRPGPAGLASGRAPEGAVTPAAGADPEAVAGGKLSRLQAPRIVHAPGRDGAAVAAGAAAGPAAAGPPPNAPAGRIPTIDEAPEEPPRGDGDVTYAPSEHPKPLAPAGSISVVNYPFKTEAEARAYEEAQRKYWEERKARELEGMLVFLKRELGLTDVQHDRLRQLLLEESRQRIQVVEDLTNQRISQTEFRERVDRILGAAREQMALILTPEQNAKYQTLEPRRQVLNDRTIMGH